MLQKAIQWVQHNHLNGQAIPITDRQRRPYPEVTGYYIPTLLSIGEITLAEKCARWLVSVQNPNGSFSLSDPNICYVFDTGQVIRGWVSILDRLPELAKPLERACEWIIQTSDPMTGRFQCPAPGGDWSLGSRGEVNEGIHLYVIQPLRDAARLLNKPAIQIAADRALAFYLQNPSITDFARTNALTHFYGYIQEALFELGFIAEARKGMASLAQFQQNNGAVPGYFDVSWVCSTGLAQLAKVWYFLNETKRADAAMAFLSQLQNGSGGFYGSYGVNASYFPMDEISWAVKYVIEAEQLRIARHFDQTAHQYAPSIQQEDGRVKAILGELKNARRVLDAGCGKGRYANLIKQLYPHIEMHAVDVSDEMLRHVSQNIDTKKASIQSLPYPNGVFDCVYCVETLEHVPNPEAAINEMVRVLAPGGRLVIIDKNLEKQGALKIETWERWFGINALSALLKKCHLETQANFVSYDGKAADGLFVAWVGTKQHAAETKEPSVTVNFYRENFINDLNRALVEACKRGDKAWIKNHLKNQDTEHSSLFPDELFENRFGMQLIQQLLLATKIQCDIVDIACGNASLLRRLQKDGHHIQGVDVSPIRVKNNADIAIQEGFCEELPLKDQTADIVIALECMEHVYDLDLALRECMRILRKGGVFFCQVPLENFADGSNHVRLFNGERLRRAVAGVGFTVLDIFLIPYLVNEAPENLFIIAKRPGEMGIADLLQPIIARMKQPLSTTENS